jgi:small GTP-binding protein
VIIGDSGVGKSNIMLRLIDEKFNALSKATIGVELATKTIVIDDVRIKSHIWDTAGQEKYQAVTKTFFRGANGIIIVYDLTKSSTFDNVGKWMSDVKENSEPNAVIMLIGNKCDLETRSIQ